jgi:hypothetical protein
VSGGPPVGCVGAVERGAGVGAGFGVAVAAVDGGRFVVWSRVVRSLREAEDLLVGWGAVWALAGLSFASEVRFPVEGVTSARLRLALPGVRDLVGEGRVAHDHDGGTLEQMGRCQVLDTEAGPTLSRVRSGGEIAAVKAVVWAVDAVRQHHSAPPSIY